MNSCEFSLEVVGLADEKLGIADCSCGFLSVSMVDVAAVGLVPCLNEYWTLKGWAFFC